MWFVWTRLKIYKSGMYWLIKAEAYPNEAPLLYCSWEEALAAIGGHR